MGMFDYIKVPEFDCPYCEEVIPASSDEFQTKDLDCSLEVRDWVEADRFYGKCKSCNKWVEYAKEPISGYTPFEQKGYKLVVKD